MPGRSFPVILCLAMALLLGCGAVHPFPAPSPAPDAPPEGPLPPLLAALMAAHWRLADLARLPAAEASYAAAPEGPDFVEHAYEGGSLRLYTDAAGSAAFALLVDSDDPRFADYRRLRSSAGYSVTVAAQYVVVCRAAPLDEAEFLSLRALRFATAGDLTGRLGPPSYVARTPTSTLYAYLPEGLLFAGRGSLQLAAAESGDPAPPAATDQSYEAYRQQLGLRLAAFAQRRAWELARVADALDRGRPSPDGRGRAAYLDPGPPGVPWLLLQRPGRAEWRQPVPGGVVDYAWLDDGRLVYALQADAATLYSLNAASGLQRLAARLEAPVAALGLAGPGHLWWQSGDGLRHELALPGA